MSPTVTIDEDSEPGGWAKYEILSDLMRVKVVFQARAIATVIGAPTAMDPRCARCGAALCNHSDAEWKG